jgi:hypothetical protein
MNELICFAFEHVFESKKRKERMEGKKKCAIDIHKKQRVKKTWEFYRTSAELKSILCFFYVFLGVGGGGLDFRLLK